MDNQRLAMRGKDGRDCLHDVLGIGLYNRFEADGKV